MEEIFVKYDDYMDALSGVNPLAKLQIMLWLKQGRMRVIW